MRKLPLAFACDRRWRELDGSDPAVRRCADCGCDVVNLSALDEVAAEELLRQRTARVCVSYRHEGGAIRFARTRRTAVVAAAAAVLLAAPATFADTTLPAPAPPPPRRSKGKAKSAKQKHVKKQDACSDGECGGVLMPGF